MRCRGCTDFEVAGIGGWLEWGCFDLVSLPASSDVGPGKESGNQAPTATGSSQETRRRFVQEGEAVAATVMPFEAGIPVTSRYGRYKRVYRKQKHGASVCFS